MQLRAEELAGRLERALIPVVLLHGDDPLLMQEAADGVRAACRKQGFSERTVLDADARYDWNQLIAECNSLSLFAERKLVEVRLPSGKPGVDGAKVLKEVCARPSEDQVVLIVSGKLEKSATTSAWFKAIDAAGATVQIWPLRRHELPRWIGRRLQQAGFKPSEDAVQLLADRVEGNLLAAVQEIEKLKLLAQPGPIDAQMLSSLVSDSARFAVFDLADRMLEGDATGAVRTLWALRAEGEEPLALVGMLASEARKLLRVIERRANGEGMEQAVRAERMMNKPHYPRAIERLGRPGLNALLRGCAGIDRAVKGLEKRAPWEELQDLALRIAGNPQTAGRRRTSA